MPSYLHSRMNKPVLNSTAEEYIALIHARGQIDPEAINAAYHSLGLVRPELILGEWGRSVLETSHPVGDTLTEIR
jgi:hypothetical protein